jgi:hypothetical protein
MVRGEGAFAINLDVTEQAALAALAISSSG